MTAPAPLRCASCSHRFGRRAVGILMFTDFLVCQSCATSPEAHGRVFKGCMIPGCIALDHSGARTTIGVARRTLTLTGHLEGN